MDFRGFNEMRRRMKPRRCCAPFRNAVIVPMMVALMISGCGAPRKKVVVHRKNPLLKCEADRTTQARMTTLINAARNQARRCGSRRYAPAGNVGWNPRLADAAKRQASYMAAADRLSHAGTDNSTVGQRVSAAGYRWQAVAENIAAGLETSEQAVEQWLRSPGHCRNIMEGGLLEIGAACRRNRASRYGTYWTLVLGTPLN